MLNKLQIKRGGFTLVEIMIVVAIIALLAAIAVPNFMRARKRSQATTVLNDLRLLNAAVDQYAIDYNKGQGASYTATDLQAYLKPGTRLYSAIDQGDGGVGLDDMFGNVFPWSGQIDVPMGDAQSAVSLNPATFAALSDVADASFWSPYGAADNL